MKKSAKMGKGEREGHGGEKREKEGKGSDGDCLTLAGGCSDRQTNASRRTGFDSEWGS